MTTKKINKTKWTKTDEVMLYIFGYIGIFGWFAPIWIDEYRWKLAFTCLLSLGLAMLFQMTKEKNQKEKKENGKE